MSETPAMSRRTILTGLLLAAPALAGCSVGSGSRSVPPDPLIALAAAARADAALAAATMAAAPSLADRVEPLRTARTEHAAALEAEVARLAPGRTPSPSAPAPATPVPAGSAPTQARLRDAIAASGVAAAAAVLELPADRVGLVASIAACCTTYAAVLG